MLCLFLVCVSRFAVWFGILEVGPARCHCWREGIRNLEFQKGPSSCLSTDGQTAVRDIEILDLLLFFFRVASIQLHRRC